MTYQGRERTTSLRRAATGLNPAVLHFASTKPVAGGPSVHVARVIGRPAWALLVAAGLMVLEGLNSNLLGPILQGRALKVPPLIVMAAILIWGLLWGIAGAILAVPMTVVLTVLLARSTATRPIAMVLSWSRSDEDLDSATSAH